MPALVRVAIAFVAFATVLRLAAAAAIPLTADEAYYWTWSLHPAFGYTDHPPLVAWLIWLGTRFGQEPGFVRLPFVLCEAVAALGVARAAALLADDPRAGAIAAIAFTLIPQGKLAIGEALPDGPYVAAWALALWAAAALARRPTTPRAAALGAALGAAVLSRAFGWALVAGIAGWALMPARRPLRPALPLAGAIVALAYAPFVAWNASVGWENLVFTFHTRQRFGAAGLGRITVISTARFLVYGLLTTALTWLVALRSRARLPLVAWTALPLTAALGIASFVTTTESYWLLGPVTSLTVGIGVVLARAGVRLRRGWAIAGTAAWSYTTASALFLALPEPAQAVAFARAPALRGPFASGVYAFGPLAERLRAIVPPGTAILVDRFETAAELRRYGLDPLLAVRIAQTPQWRRWHADEPVPQRAALVTFGAPLAALPDLARSVAAAYENVVPGPRLAFSHAGVAEDTYYVAWLARPLPAVRAALPGL